MPALTICLVRFRYYLKMLILIRHGRLILDIKVQLRSKQCDVLFSCRAIPIEVYARVVLLDIRRAHIPILFMLFHFTHTIDYFLLL